MIDLMAALMDALDALDVGVVEEETSPAGFVCILPAGRVRIRLEHGPHVSIFDAGEPDEVPSDQWPALPADSDD